MRPPVVQKLLHERPTLFLSPRKSTVIETGQMDIKVILSPVTVRVNPVSADCSYHQLLYVKHKHKYTCI